jgi:low temperature requirement protein LtrA
MQTGAVTQAWPPPSFEKRQQCPNVQAAMRHHVRMADDTTQVPEVEEPARHATYIELFLDLVFVFAVAQIVLVLAANPSPAGFGRVLLLAWLVWWLWSQFAWLGTAIDLGSGSRSQLLVLVAVPPTLLMAIAIPEAYGDAALQFAGAYLVVNLWCLAIQGQGAWSDSMTRSAVLQYAPVAMVAPVLLLIGAFFDGGVRIAIWCVAAVITVASVLAGGRNAEGKSAWRVNASHFAERHALFVIISLGEVVVAIGVAAASAITGIGVATALGVVAAAALACALWWTYFAFVPRVVEQALSRAPDHERGRLARDLFSFGHFPIVFGILICALTAKHVAADPYHHLGVFDLFALAGGVAMFVGGLMGLRWYNVHSVGLERPLGILAVVAICAVLGPSLPGVVVVAAVALVLIVMQSVTLLRIRAANS